MTTAVRNYMLMSAAAAALGNLDGYIVRMDDAAGDEKAKKDAEEQAKKDADAGTEPDKILRGIADRLDACMKRMDAWDEEDKKRSDARRKDAEDEEKEKKDAADEEEKKDGEDEEMRTDKKRKDSKKRKDDDEDMEEGRTDKKRKDAEDDKEKKDARKDAADAPITVADLDRLIALRMPVMPGHSDYDAMLESQARADKAYHAHGDRAPQSLPGEGLVAYRRRLLNGMKKHSATWGEIDLGAVADQKAFGKIEDAIYADAVKAAESLSNLPNGGFRERVTIDPHTGVRTVSFHGQGTFIRDMKPGANRVSNKFQLPK